MTPSFQSHSSAGYLLVLVLVFASVFLIVISSFIGFVISQNQVVNFRFEQQRATEIAEAGLNYYKWYLAHFPDDVTNGTGLPGPYIHTYSDPEDGYIGEFSLSVSSTTYCGSVASIEVSSTGHTYQDPSAVSSVSARYTRPTVAEYSFITNRATWYGSDRIISGPVHSNQGIRMDGSHNSFIGSGLNDWECTSTFGCTPDQTVDGVYTTSGNATPGLFSFPVSPVDFVGLTIDLANMKDRAQNNGGVYFPPSAGYGYEVVFNGDGTVTVREVSNTASYWAYSSAEGWHTSERNIITAYGPTFTRTVDAACPLLYFEDKIWLEGDVSQKVTVAAADLNSGAQTNIVLSGNIDYVPGNNAGLLAIAEDDIDIGLVVPDDMRVDGIFVAQNGRFGINRYSTAYLSSTYDPYVIRNSLTRFGSVISNGRVGTRWNSGATQVSGFTTRNTSFDINLVNDPPPLTPETSDVYTFEDWRQDG